MSSEKYVIRSYEAARLDDQELQKLIVLIKPIYLCFYPSSTHERIHRRLTSSTSTVVDLLFDGDTFCAFGIYYTCKIQDKKILFRDGTMVNPNLQSKGLYRFLVQHALDKHSPDFMVTRTQNPRVYEMFKKFSLTGIIYPSEGATPPQEVLNIAHLMCRDGTLDPKTLVAKDVYSRGQGRDDAPFFETRDQDVVRFFRHALTLRDAFMVITPTS